MNIIALPFQYVLDWLNFIFNSYPLTIFVFTILVNAAMLPLNFKQQKSMAKQARLKPKLDALKQRCGDDKMKYQNEMTQLYQRENVSPAGGCLPMILRMVLLIGVYTAIRNMIGLDATKAGDISDNPQFLLFGLNTSVQPKFTTDIGGAIANGQMIYWIIPLLCFLASMASSIISQAQQKKINPQADVGGGSMKIMMYLMPLMSLFIAFGVPCLVGFYWICSNIATTVVQLFVNEFYSADKVLAIEIAKQGKKRRQEEAAKIKA